jgi:hypothetical protein
MTTFAMGTWAYQCQDHGRWMERFVSVSFFSCAWQPAQCAPAKHNCLRIGWGERWPLCLFSAQREGFSFSTIPLLCTACGGQLSLVNLIKSNIFLLWSYISRRRQSKKEILSYTRYWRPVTKGCINFQPDLLGKGCHVTQSPAHTAVLLFLSCWHTHILQGAGQSQAGSFTLSTQGRHLLSFRTHCNSEFKDVNE